MRQPYLITAMFHTERVRVRTLEKLGVNRQTKMTRLVYAESYEEATQRLGKFINEAVYQMNTSDRPETFLRVSSVTYTNETIQ